MEARGERPCSCEAFLGLLSLRFRVYGLGSRVKGQGYREEAKNRPKELKLFEVQGIALSNMYK